MRTREIVGTFAVAGAVAAFALFNMNYMHMPSSFLAEANTEYEDAFNTFIAQHHKSYGTKEEYQYRLAVFSQNFHHIKSHNMMNSQEQGYSLAVNKFSDMTKEEFKKMLGYNAHLRRANKAPVVLEVEDLPDSIDWREKGAVTPVKNQGQCGSCWAFSTTGSLEGLYAIKNGNQLSFSEQQLVDCSTDQGNQGCNGGLMDNAFKYVENNSIETEAAYPYTAQDGSCQAKSSEGKFEIKSYQDVTPNDPKQLMAAVAQQPVSVAIEADTQVFQSYSSGVISSDGCGTNLDHGVLVVGYGTEGSTDYWILKNSWGPEWGEKGYFRIARDLSKQGPGICGLQEDPSYPTD